MIAPRARPPLRRLILGTVAALAFAGAARADDDQLIVVTGFRDGVPGEAGVASKTGTALIDTPAAVVVIPEALLVQQGARTFDAALANASSVAPVFGGGYGAFDTYLVRGLRMRFLRDGLPDGPSFNGYYRLTADVAAIEVLKGPGSALFGRAEPGGSINVVTKAPADQFAASVEGQGGSRDTWLAVGDVTGPVGSGLGARLIGDYYHTGGIRGLARTVWEVLPSLRWQASNAVAVTLDYDHRDNRAVVDNYGIPFTTARTIADVDRSTRFYSPFNRVDQSLDRITLRLEASIAANLSARVAAIHDERQIAIIRNAGGVAGTTAVTSGGRIGGRNGRTQDDRTRFQTAQGELVWRPTTGAVAHTILVGAEHERLRLATTRFTYALPDVALVSGAVIPERRDSLVLVPGFERRIVSDTSALYVQHELAWAERLRLRGGIRVDFVDFADEGVVTGRARRIADDPALVSGQVGAVLRPTAATALFAGWSTGRFINIQTESAALTTQPERSEQIEAGIKSEWLGRRLGINLTAFETRRDNYYAALSPGADPLPVGRQRTRGLELDLIGKPVADVTLSANLSLLEARNRSGELASVPGIAVNQPVLGRAIAATPARSGSLWAAWEPTLGPLAGLLLGGGIIHRSGVYVDNLELLRVPGYTIANAAIGWRIGTIEARVNVTNVADERYFTVPTFIGALPGDGRAVQLTLRAAL